MTKRGRKQDTKIIYTPEQTQRYKKGLELARSNLMHKVDDKTYRIESLRSPVGYWEVECGSPDVEGESAWLLEYDYSQTSFSNHNLIDTTISEETTRFTSSLARHSSLKGGVQDGALRFITRRDGTIGFNLSALSVSYIYNWSVSHSATVDQAYSESGGGYYYPVIYIYVYSSNINYDDDKYIYSGGRNDISLSGSAQRTTSLPIDEFTNSKDLQFGLQFDVRGTSSNVDININQSFSILGINGEPVGGEYKCTCPDFSLTESAFTPPEYPSMSQPRTWQASNAGCPTWADGKRRCCHIVAVQTIRQEEIPAPQNI